ncbi:MAG: site-2 protease family protein [Acidimicrobiales bacterium]
MDVLVHWTFVLLILLVVWGSWAGGIGLVAAGLVWVAAVFGSVLLHELAHCVVARRRGAIVEDILLIPLGGISQLSKMPEAPADEFAISVVGPLTSIGIGLLAVLAGLLVGARLWPPTLFAGSWFARLAWLNLLLGAFNLLPALPMDGGRVLRAFLAGRYDRRYATFIAARTARFFAIVMIFVGFIYDFWFALIGVFILVSASAEENAAEGSDRHDGSSSTRHPAGAHSHEHPGG